MTSNVIIMTTCNNYDHVSQFCFVFHPRGSNGLPYSSKCPRCYECYRLLCRPLLATRLTAAGRFDSSQLRWLQTELCAFGCPQMTQPKHQSPRCPCERPLYPCLRAVSLLGPAASSLSAGPHFAESRRCFLVAPLRPRRLRARHPRCQRPAEGRSDVLLCLLSVARLQGGRSLFCKCSMTRRWGVCKGFSRPCRDPLLLPRLSPST